MKVKDAIENVGHFIISQGNGDIMAIKNGMKYIAVKNNEVEALPTELLEREVENIEVLNGMYEDYMCIKI